MSWRHGRTWSYYYNSQHRLLAMPKTCHQAHSTSHVEKLEANIFCGSYRTGCIVGVAAVETAPERIRSLLLRVEVGDLTVSIQLLVSGEMAST
jgi:hypothetical protein